MCTHPPQWPEHQPGVVTFADIVYISRKAIAVLVVILLGIRDDSMEPDAVAATVMTGIDGVRELHPAILLDVAL